MATNMRWLGGIVGSLLAAALIFAAAAEDEKEGKKREGKPEHKPPQCAEHDFSKFKDILKPTEEQKTKMDEVRNKINEETKGNNRCMLWFLHDELKKLGKGGGEDAKAKMAEIEKMKETIKNAMEKMRTEREALMNDEQKKALEEMKAMMKEHREKCMKEKEGDKDHPKKHKPEAGPGEEPLGPPEAEGDGMPFKSGCTKEEAAKDGVFHRHHKDDHPKKEAPAKKEGGDGKN